MDRSIKTYSLEELSRVTAEAAQPKFRNKQLFEWLHKHHALSYDEMTNLPKAFREFLSQNYPLNSPQIADKQVSIDGTRKYILRLHDGSLVETVGIPSSDGKRLSVCVSSQVGCAIACEFCATGREGFSRNLEPLKYLTRLLSSNEILRNQLQAWLSWVKANHFSISTTLLLRLKS